MKITFSDALRGHLAPYTSERFAKEKSVIQLLKNHTIQVPVCQEKTVEKSQKKTGCPIRIPRCVSSQTPQGTTDR